MIHRSRTALLLLLLAVATVGAVPAAAGAVTVGISDQTTGMFHDAHFKNLKIKQARYMVSWNVMAPGHVGELYAAYAWLSAARKDGVSPLISIAPDQNDANKRCGQDSTGNCVPGIGTYSYWVQKFIAAFPWVKQYTPWNEPDWKYRTTVARHPALAAGYFNQLYTHCPGCAIVAGDFSDAPASELRPYVRAYARALRHKPAGWAVHNYRDVRTHTTTVLRMMQRAVRGPIWLTEISGVERRGHWQYADQSPPAAGRDEAFLFGLPKRFPRVKRIYHYQWSANANVFWDSGLLGATGGLRPAYYVVKKATGH